MELDYDAVGVRLHKARKKKGLTQEQLAEQAQISTQHISNIEHGHTKLSLPMLIKLANVLSVTPDYLLTESYYCSKAVFRDDLAELVDQMDDCEMRLTVEMIRSTLPVLRKYDKFPTE